MDLMAVLVQKSNGNIQGVLALMESLPLQRVKNMLEFWQELTLDPSEREKRVRKEGDAEAALALDKLMTGKIEVDKTKVSKDKNADPETLDRFMGLGLDLGMLVPKKITPHKEN
jgi:hypothetical protein